MTNENEMDRMISNLNTIWLAFLIFLTVYLFLGLFLNNNFQASINENVFSIIKVILYIISFFDLIISFYIRKFILSNKYKIQQPGLTLQQILLKKYLKATIITLVILESIGVYGLILFLLGKNLFDLYIFLIISAIAIFIFRPKKDELINLIKDNQDKSNKDRVQS